MKIRPCSLAVVALATAVVPVEAQTALNANSHVGPRASQRSPSAYPTTWYVDVNAAPPGTGRQASPYTSIEYALGLPTTLDGDTIVVFPGTYFEHIAFAGKDVRVVSVAGPETTIVDANFVGSVASFLDGESEHAVLDGFTLRGGIGSGTMPEIRGGGVLCIGASPTLRNLIVRENQAKRGAGMYFGSSSARVESCVIEQNEPPAPYVSDNYGGGVYVACGASVVFDHCTMRNNKYGSGAGIFGRGGGVFGGGTYLWCTIEDNGAFQSSGVDGGACNPQLIDCVIKNNRNWSTEATASIAGGVYGPAVLTRCTIDGNYGWFNGGGAYNATLVSCTLSNNLVDYDHSTSSSGAGGGASVCTLVDCDVFGNEARGAHPTFLPGRGGGLSGGTATRCRIFDNEANLGGGAFGSHLERCTLYGNMATSGGGLVVSSGTSNVRNSILYANSPTQIVLTGSGAANVTYSDVQGTYPGTGNIDADPMFVSEALHDFHLVLGSPCIDTGDPTTFDPDASRADMGAYPYAPGFADLLAQSGSDAADASGRARQETFRIDDVYVTSPASRAMDSFRAQRHVLDRSIAGPLLIALSR